MIDNLRKLVRIYWQFGGITVLLGTTVYAVFALNDPELLKYIAMGTFGGILALIGSWNGERKAKKEE